MKRDLTLVIPCYNEAKRLPLETYTRFAEANPNVRFCFVDDGSRDGTRALLKEFCARFPRVVELVTLPRNQGKAAAVRTGMLYVLFVLHPKPDAYVGFWDADLATPLPEALRFMDVLASDARCDCVIGSRKPRSGAQIERTFPRHAISRVIAFFIRHCFRCDVYDSQCGAKIFRADSVSALFEKPFVSRWLFDVELLLRMDNPARQVRELPLNEWHDVAGSKLKFYHGAKIIFDLARIALIYHGARVVKKLWSTTGSTCDTILRHENPHR